MTDSVTYFQPDSDDLDEQAVRAFLRLRDGRLTQEESAGLQARLAGDPAFAKAFEQAGELWKSVNHFAASPELMAMRQQAIARARRSSANRWRGPLRTWRGWRAGAAALAAMLALGMIVQLSPFGYRSDLYRTGIGEQQVVELDDHSRIALDARTTLQVRYSDNARVVNMVEGQAQFSVAKDPARPFKVQVGDRTVIALGTVFTVEYIDQQMRVTMLEGRVAVLPPPGGQDVADRGSSPHSGKQPNGVPAVSVGVPSGGIELKGGEEMRIAPDGHAKVVDADLDAATAWRSGKLIFHNLPLDQAVRRLNRYSRLQLQIEDPTLAALPVSGVFEAGNTSAFAEALESYLPLAADHSEPGSVRLRRR